MNRKILPLLLTLLIVFILPMSTAQAINLGRTVYDTELPETVSDSTFDAENPGINFGLCAGFGDIPAEDCFLSEQEVQEIIEYEPADESEYAPFIAEGGNEATANAQPAIVKTVYVNEGLSEEEVQAMLDASQEGTDGVLLFDENDEGGKVLGASSVRDSLKPMLDDLAAKVTSMEKEVEKSGASISDIILILLVIILSGLTLRTELRYQKLSETYKNVKNNFSAKKWTSKQTKTPPEKKKP